MSKTSKRQNNAKRKPKRAGRSATATMAWMSVLGLVAFSALELSNLFRLWPAQTNEVGQASEHGDRGTLVLKTEENRCERMKYDEPGHVVEQFRLCSNSDLQLDEHGRPLPIGTMHRLEAISNSFRQRR
jgi:hypothetical protein